MPATRYVDGVKFVKSKDGWQTDDGAYVIEYDDTFETECDNQHPMRISKAMRAAYWASSEWDRKRRWDWEVAWAIRNHKRGYLCPGNSVHYYALWVAVAVASDVISRDDSLKDAMYHVARHIKTGENFA